MKKTFVFSAIFASAILGTLLFSCSAKRELTSPLLGGKLYTSAWMQKSAEYKALCLQAYNIASDRIETLTKEPRRPGDKPLAVVTDIDETFLDNTPNSVHEALKGRDFDQASWTDWCARAEADTLAGALKFFCLAADRGVTVFYITNRNEAERKGTLRNLQRFGFPFADENHLLTKSQTSNKEERRRKVMQAYEIALLLGDNLGDFAHVFDAHNGQVRNKAVGEFARDFGRKFILLPNPNYGTWEPTLFGGYPPIQMRDKILRSRLKNY